MRRLAPLVIAAAATVLLTAAGQPAPQRMYQAYSDAQKADLDKVSAYLNGIRTLKSTFVQVGPEGGINQGTLYIAKPGRIRFEYNPPSPLLMVATGGAFYVKNATLNTLDKYDLSDTPLGLLLNDTVDLARNKVPRGHKSALRDNAVVQSNLALAEVNVRAARGFVLQSMADIWQELSAGTTITVEQRMTVRMAATHAIHMTREAVDFAYNAAGTMAIFENHPLERRFREIHTVTQQVQGRLSHFETVGAWMLGLDTDLTFV